MSYAEWEPRYRVTTIAPGKIDLFAITYVDGKQAAVHPIMDYDEALAKARAFHRDNPRCQIKVLPVDGKEACNLLGIERAKTLQPIDPALRQQMIDRLMQIVGDSNDSDARRDALDLLKAWGVMKAVQS